MSSIFTNSIIIRPVFYQYTYPRHSQKMFKLQILGASKTHLLMKAPRRVKLWAHLGGPISPKKGFLKSVVQAASLSRLNDPEVVAIPAQFTCTSCSLSHVLQVPRKDTAYCVTFRAKNLKYHHLSHHPSVSLPPLYLCLVPSLRSVSLTVTSQ